MFSIVYLVSFEVDKITHTHTQWEVVECEWFAERTFIVIIKTLHLILRFTKCLLNFNSNDNNLRIVLGGPPQI